MTDQDYINDQEDYYKHFLCDLQLKNNNTFLCECSKSNEFQLTSDNPKGIYIDQIYRVVGEVNFPQLRAISKIGCRFNSVSTKDCRL